MFTHCFYIALMHTLKIHKDSLAAQYLVHINIQSEGAGHQNINPLIKRHQLQIICYLLCGRRYDNSYKYIVLKIIAAQMEEPSITTTCMTAVNDTVGMAFRATWWIIEICTVACVLNLIIMILTMYGWFLTCIQEAQIENYCCPNTYLMVKPWVVNKKENGQLNDPMFFVGCFQSRGGWVHQNVSVLQQWITSK